MNDFIANATVEADKIALAEIATALTAETASKEKELSEANQTADKAATAVTTAQIEASAAKNDLVAAEAREKELITALKNAKEAVEAAEETAEEAKKMLLEATEQLDGVVNTKKGVSKQTVKEGGKAYMVNPNRKFNGVPGYGDRVFTGNDVVDNVVTVAHEGKTVKLRAYLVATGASIMEETGGE